MAACHAKAGCHGASRRFGVREQEIPNTFKLSQVSLVPDRASPILPTEIVLSPVAACVKRNRKAKGEFIRHEVP